MDYQFLVKNIIPCSWIAQIVVDRQEQWRKKGTKLSKCVNDGTIYLANYNAVLSKLIMNPYLNLLQHFRLLNPSTATTCTKSSSDNDGHKYKTKPHNYQVRHCNSKRKQPYIENLVPSALFSCYLFMGQFSSNL